MEASHSEPSVVVDETLKDVLTANSSKYAKHNSLFYVQRNSKSDLQDVVIGIEKYLKELNKSFLDKKALDKNGWVIKQVNEYFSPTKCQYRLDISSQAQLLCDA